MTICQHYICGVYQVHCFIANDCIPLRRIWEQRFALTCTKSSSQMGLIHKQAVTEDELTIKCTLLIEKI